MSNPYQSPQSYGQPSYGSQPGEDREKMRSVARYQQYIIYALLANLGLYIGAVATRGLGLGLAILAVAVMIALFSIVAMFLLASTLHNPVVGVLCAILMCIPCVSLITLLIINQQATSYLSTRGVKVGFMGVNPDSI